MRLRSVLAAICGCMVATGLSIWFGVFEPEAERTCRDGWLSPSIGIIGACSHHGGVKPREKNRALLLIGALIAGYATFAALSGDRPIDSPDRKAPAGPGESARESEHSGIGVVCPLCGSQMKLRTAHRGRRKGQQFLGCSKYPTCKGITSIAK